MVGRKGKIKFLFLLLAATFLGVSSALIVRAATLTISNVEVSAATTTATITWTTNLPADSEVSYLWFLSKTNLMQQGLATDHSVSLTGLFPDQSYSYTIKSIGQDGQSAFKDYANFTTAATAGSSSTITIPPVESPSSETSSISTVTAGHPTFTKYLYFGLHDAQVGALQSFLAEHGYLSSANTTGFFGNLTFRAIQKFQCDQEIVCTGGTGWGTVGPKTRGVLNKLSP